VPVLEDEAGDRQRSAAYREESGAAPAVEDDRVAFRLDIDAPATADLQFRTQLEIGAVDREQHGAAVGDSLAQ
jgi:hypothetical protein